jgi:hypothetical protein
MKYIFLLNLVLLYSCKYSVTFNKFKELADDKIKVESIESQLNQNNHLILKKYFSQIKNTVLEVQRSTRMQKYIHKYFNSYYDEKFCDEVLLDDVKYMEILKKCYINGFYICAEEVKYYKQILIVVKKLLTEKELGKIRENKICYSKLVKLGVFSE